MLPGTPVKAVNLPAAKLQAKAGEREASRPTAGLGQTLGMPEALGESSDAC